MGPSLTDGQSCAYLDAVYPSRGKRKKFMKRKIISILTLLLVATLAFAQGAKEVVDDETVVKVLSVSVEDGEVYRARVQRQDGQIVVYRADSENTVSSVPFEQIGQGSILAVKDNGIATMSIPAQMYATEIRDLTLGVALGAYDFKFTEPFLTEPNEIQSEAALWEIELTDDIAQLFSYSYGYDMMRGYIEQGVTFRGSYFARGVLDFWTNAEPMETVDEMGEAVNEYVETIYNQGLGDTSGPVPQSIDEIMALEGFEDLSQRFSYAYGYVTGYQDYLSMITVDPVKFVEGCLSAIYNVDPLLDEAERTDAVNTYVNQLVEDYMAAIDQLAADNLQKAENFLNENAQVENMITLDSGLQLEVVKEGDGATPTADDTVTVNYTLRDINGNQLDAGNGAVFPLSNLIPGFAEAVQNMKVGGETIAYVHPDLGYGEAGAGAVEPNSLLIFDIELTGIEE